MIIFTLGLCWLLSIVFGLFVVLLGYISKNEELYYNGNTILLFSFFTGYISFIPMIIYFIRLMVVEDKVKN